MVNHPGEPITEAQIPGLEIPGIVRQAYDRSATTRFAWKGFEETNIWSHNAQIFMLTDFILSLMSDLPSTTKSNYINIGETIWALQARWQQMLNRRQ